LGGWLIVLAATIGLELDQLSNELDQLSKTKVRGW